MYYLSKRELVTLIGILFLVGFASGAGAVWQFAIAKEDPRLATMCRGPQEPGEGMFITMDKDRKYHCWDNFK